MSDLSNLRDFYLECDSAMGDIELNLGICLDLGKSRLCFFLLFLLLLVLLLFVCLFYVSLFAIFFFSMSDLRRILSSINLNILPEFCQVIVIKGHFDLESNI